MWLQTTTDSGLSTAASVALPADALKNNALTTVPVLVATSALPQARESHRDIRIHSELTQFRSPTPPEYQMLHRSSCPLLLLMAAP